MFVGSQTFNPGQIIVQIAALQVIFYISLLCLQGLIVAPFSPAGLTIDHIFNADFVKLDKLPDGMLVLAYLLNAMIMAAGLRFVVARAKKCIDFGSTIYILHIAACWGARGFPWNFVYWAVVTTCSALSILLGELLCVRHEMSDIPISGKRKKDGRSSSSSPALELV